MATIIFRYKFSEEFLPTLVEFSRIHQYDKASDFKEAFKTFLESNGEIVQNETKYLKDSGYTGNVVDKMYKSARYYFKNKDYKPQVNKTRRKYIKQDKNFIYHIDDDVAIAIRNDVKPAIAYKNFIEDDINKSAVENEKNRLREFLDDDSVTNKIKKTYKNRYFIQRKIINENNTLESMAEAMAGGSENTPNAFVPNVSLWEFREYQHWQRIGGRKPDWFMKDNNKANDIMRHFNEVEAHFGK